MYSDLLVYYGYMIADDALPIRIWISTSVLGPLTQTTQSQYIVQFHTGASFYSSKFRCLSVMETLMERNWGSHHNHYLKARNRNPPYCRYLTRMGNDNILTAIPTYHNKRSEERRVGK